MADPQRADWRSLDDAPQLVKELGYATRDWLKPGDGRVKVGHGVDLDAYVFWIRPGQDPLWFALPTLPDDGLSESTKRYLRSRG